MKLVVWKVNDWAPSKHNGYDYRRVMFKDDETNKTIYLNLTKNTSPQNWQYWDQYLKEGNVLDVVINPNTGNVNQFEAFQVVEVKEKNKDEVSDSIG